MGGLLTLSGLVSAAEQVLDPDGLARLARATENRARISLDRTTGTASFVRIEPGALRLDTPGDASFSERTQAFLDEYGSIFGLRNPAGELDFVGESIDAYGLAHVQYRQVYLGVPVFGSELKSHFDRDGNLTTINASTIPIEALDPTPAWLAAKAEDVAVAEVVRALEVRMAAADLHAVGAELLVFRTGMLQGVSGINHLSYRVEVVNNTQSIREFVFVDAHTGKVLDQITGIHDGLYRRAYDGLNLPDVPPSYPGSPFWVEGDSFPTGTTEADNMILASGETYDLFSNAFVRDSFDGAGATMDSIFNRGYGCPNASWNGTFISFCPGFTTDDVTAHEWGHAYTEYTNNLIYQWQSGALNESYSDIWGETVDKINLRGLDSPDNPRSTGGCSNYSGGPSDDNSYRWLMGEEVTGSGAFRDMWNPNCNGDPGKVSDTEYFCSTADGGGVHFNSGVPNHAYALMVDGGTYNTKTITGLGLTKAAHIHWAAQNMLTPASDFADQADALEAACTNLVGFNLPDLSTGSASGETISAGDCTVVGEVVDAVEFRTPPTQCGFVPILDPNPPALCDGVGTVNSASLTDWEGGLGAWTVGRRNVASPGTFDTPDWAVVGSLPDSRAGMAAFVADLSIGDCITDDESGVLYLESPVIAIPAGSLVPRVAVDHWVATEAGWDGGNVKISVNGGAFTLIPTSNFDVSPYNSSLNSVGDGNTNPMASESAFTGADGGSVSGSWGGSHINLLGLAAAGDNIKLRFEFGIDGCGGVIGWYVDEVQVYSCSAELPPSCGDGVLDLGETCDDGNMTDGDGCSSSCGVENGWMCTDPIPANPVGTNVVADWSFEGGVPNADWTALSTFGGVAGFPLCSPGTCGVDLANTGTWYVWIGGISTGVTSSVEQSVTIPAAATDLTVQTLRGVCDDPSDTLHVSLDSTDIGTVVCDGVDGAFVEQTFSVAPFNDDGSHTLFIGGTVGGTNGNHSNFFVDDVVLIDNIPTTAVPSMCTIIPVCGNGTLEAGEVCDDGNASAGDGCSDTCEVEAGWNCTVPSAPGVIPDFSFEAGASGGVWTEASTNFGTPICDVGSCGTGGGTGPSDGDFWVWFGGIGDYEEGSVSQGVTIPATATDITFDLEQIICDSASDYMEMLVDGNQEFFTDGGSGLCGSLGYTPQAVDISAYADGGVHSLEFHSEIFAVNAGGSNFFLDRIELPGSPSICTAIIPEIFSDGFESGNTSVWSSTIPAP